MAKFHGIPIPANATPEIVALLGDIERWVVDRDKEPRQLPSFTVAQLGDLDPAHWPNCAVICSNEAGGRTVATSDGSDWCRVSDGTPVS